MDAAVFDLAEQVVRDVLAIRGPVACGNGTFRMTTEYPWLSEVRAALARRFERLVPAGATLTDVPRIARELAPLLVTAGR